MHRSSKSLMLSLAIAATLLFWASSFVGIRSALHDYQPGALALLRYSVASLVMLALYLKLPTRRTPTGTEFIKLILLGFIGFGCYNIFLNYGEITISAGEASFIIGMMPAFTVLLSSLVLGEHISTKTIIGICISFTGLYLIYYAQASTQHYAQGIALVFAATLSGSIYSVFQKPLLKEFHPIEITAFAIWSGTCLLTLLYLPQLQHNLHAAHWTNTLTIIYMGVFPAAIAYVSWSYVLKHWPANKAAMILYCLPIISTLMGIALLHEYPPHLALLGGVITLLGGLLPLLSKMTKAS